MTFRLLARDRPPHVGAPILAVQPYFFHAGAHVTESRAVLLEAPPRWGQILLPKRKEPRVAPGPFRKVVLEEVRPQADRKFGLLRRLPGRTVLHAAG